MVMLRLWVALPNPCKEAEDIYTFKRMVVDLYLVVTCFNFALITF